MHDGTYMKTKHDGKGLQVCIGMVLLWGGKLLGTGCTLPSNSPMVKQTEVGVAAELSQGRVISVEEVTIEGDKTAVGVMGGASIGGATGVAAGGSGTEAIIASAVGAAAGAVVGQTVEERVTRKPGQRITIIMDDGRVIEVVQEATNGVFREGDRVNVAVGQGNTRVSMSTSIEMDNVSTPQQPAWYELQKVTRDDDGGSGF
jgi:outer membrane lipoprotein SlyB